MPFFDESGNSFFYRRWTAEDTRSVVLFLHGWGEQSGYYHRLAAELTRDGSDVWALDHVGHGLSGAHDGVFESVDQLVGNARLLLERILDESPGLPIVLMGHSLGGLTALGLASQVDTLAGLVVSGAPVAGQPEDLDDEAVWSTDETYIDNAWHDPIAVDGPDGEQSLWDNAAAFLPRLPAITAAITIPTLVIYGEKDVLIGMDDARAWAETLVNGRLVTYPEGHHDILNDSIHRRVATEVAAFVATTCGTE